MAFINLFPSVILSDILHDISDENIKDWKSFIKNSEVINEGENGFFSQNQRLLEDVIFEKLKHHILRLSRLYLNELSHDFEDVQISSSWANILTNNTKIHLHQHSNAYICGAFYLDDCSRSPIQFHSPLLDKWKFTAITHPNPNHIRKQTNFNIFPKSKSMIIFPSWLSHDVPKSLNTERITIAFNIIPKGEFGPNTQKLYL